MPPKTRATAEEVAEQRRNRDDPLGYVRDRLDRIFETPETAAAFFREKQIDPDVVVLLGRVCGDTAPVADLSPQEAAKLVFPLGVAAALVLLELGD